jgi:hypothetical protein
MDSAEVTLKTMQKFTVRTNENFDEISKRLETCLDLDGETVRTLENQLTEMVSQWKIKVEKLGAIPRGLWLADFDCGDGYYCWRFPEVGIQYWHSYTDGFSKRVRIDPIERQQMESDHAQVQFYLETHETHGEESAL